MTWFRKRRTKRSALIQAYGLFWRRDEYQLESRSGQAIRLRLYGRRGANRGKLQAVDFRDQLGIYILYATMVLITSV